MKPILSREAVPHNHIEKGGDGHVQRGAEPEPSVLRAIGQRLKNPGDRPRTASIFPNQQRRRGRNHVLRRGLGEVDVLQTAFPQLQRSRLEKSVDFAGVIDLDLQTAADLEVKCLARMREFALSVRRGGEAYGELPCVAITVDEIEVFVVPQRNERGKRFKAEFGKQFLNVMCGLLEEILGTEIGHLDGRLYAHQRLPSVLANAHSAQNDQPIGLRSIVFLGLRIAIVDVKTDFNVFRVFVQCIHFVVHTVIRKSATQTGTKQSVVERRSGKIAPHHVVRKRNQELVDRFAFSRERAQLGDTGNQQTRFVLIVGQADGPIGRCLLVVVFDHPENHALIELLHAALHTQLFSHQNGELVHDLLTPVRKLGVGKLDYELSSEWIDRKVHTDRRGT